MPPHVHPGIKRTKGTILKLFNWPNLHEDVTKFVNECLPCQRLRPLPVTKRTFSPHVPGEGPFAKVHIDYWSVTWRGENIKCLTMIDPFTKWAEAIPVTDNTGQTAASVLLNAWIARFGVPDVIVSDNDKAFRSELVDKLLTVLGCRHVTTIPYRPQGNAYIEVFHKTLNKWFRLFHRKELTFSTEEGIALALFGYRCATHTATNRTPAFMTYGRDLATPQPQDWRFEAPSERDRLIVLNQLRGYLLMKAKTLYQYAKPNPSAKLEVNDLVLCPLNINEKAKLAVISETSTKLIPEWTLPARVIGMSSNGFRITVRGILTNTTREYTKDQVRVITVPDNEKMIAVWREEAERELEARRLPKRQIESFMREVFAPQAKIARVGSSLRGES